MKWNWRVTGTSKLPMPAEFSERERLIVRYVAAMETEESADWCKCTWVWHPDDQGIKPGHCRECRKPQDHKVHSVENAEGFHFYQGIRRRRMDDHPMCPVHTREGMIAHFFDWAEKQNGGN